MTPGGPAAAHVVHEHLADQIVEDLERRPGVEGLRTEARIRSSFQTRDRVGGRASDAFVAVVEKRLEPADLVARRRQSRSAGRGPRGARSSFATSSVARMPGERGPAELEEVVARLRAYVAQDRDARRSRASVSSPSRSRAKAAASRTSCARSRVLQLLQRLAATPGRASRPRPSAAARRIGGVAIGEAVPELGPRRRVPDPRQREQRLRRHRASTLRAAGSRSGFDRAAPRESRRGLRPRTAGPTSFESRERGEELVAGFALRAAGASTRAVAARMIGS